MSFEIVGCSDFACHVCSQDGLFWDANVRSWGHYETSSEPVKALLNDREDLYGNFAKQAKIILALTVAMEDSKKWAYLKADQREALGMIATKISRILNGNPDVEDTWRDIAGYAVLVADRLLKEGK